MDQQQTSVFKEPFALDFFYGLAPTVQTLNDMLAEIAPTDIPVLIVGESGTGKDACARLIHRLSAKSQFHWQKINCAASDALEQFRQLSAPKRGAGNPDISGTLYLDNLQELDPGDQRKLLSHFPEIDNLDPRSDQAVRIISSADGTLEAEVDSGRFRRELYFRLNGASLRLPPLRERSEDIPALLEYFLGKHAAKLKRQVPAIDENGLHVVMAYRWPGNLRELENFARKMVLFGEPQRVLNDLLGSMTAHRQTVLISPRASLKVASRAASKQAERKLIMQALERTRWNRKRAARDLQISYKSLLYKIKQIGAVNEKQEG